MLKRWFAFALSLAALSVPAIAQQPLQWRYSFDANGVATATYPGNVKSNGTTESTLIVSPIKWPTVEGSIGGAGIYLDTARIGGYGSYGYNLTNAYVSAPVPSTQFDVAVTGWLSASNLVGGASYGAWFSANTPSTDFGAQTFSSGSAVGLEVNTGNRWADFGQQNDVGGTRYTIGIQSVPDIGPARDGNQTSFYPGTFGIAVLPSQHNQKWWTGWLTGINSIQPGGYGRRTRGGSVIGNAPANVEYIDGQWAGGINFSQGTFSQPVIVAASGQKVCFNTANACVLYSGGKLVYQINGANVMSVSDTGNAIFLGTVTQNGVP